MRGAAETLKLTGPVSSRIIGGVAGGAAGAYGGSKVGNPEDQQRNTLIGGVAGAAAGAFGMGRLAPKLKVLGESTSKDLAGLGEHMKQPYATKQTTLNYAARSLTPQYAAVSGKAAPTAKNFFGHGAEVKALGVQTNKPSMIGGAIGEVAKSIKTVQGASNPIKGIGQVIGQDIKDAQTFTKDIEGTKYKFQRSGLGKVVNPIMSTGAGFGAMEAMSSTNEDGSKRGVGNRLARGAGTMVGWSAAPKLMMGKMLGVDVPKMLLKKPKQQTNENGLLP
jgi:hypothetical protein